MTLQYVIVWREPPSPRLRTYVEPTTLAPYAYPLDDLKPPPHPEEILSTPDEVEDWLQSDNPDPVVILAEIVPETLGWNPIPAPHPFSATSLPF